MANYKVLTEQEISSALEELDGWSYAEGRLKRRFVFKGFRQAMAFLNLMAIEAEVLNHHPDIFQSFKKVDITLTTHAVGNKLSEHDIKLAKYLDRAAADFKS